MVEFSINSNTINGILSRISKIFETDVPMEQMKNLLIDLKDNKMTISAFNGKYAASFYIHGLEINADYRFMVDAYTFITFISKIKSVINMKVVETPNKVLQLKYGRSKTLIPIMDADTYPSIKSLPISPILSLKGYELKAVHSNIEYIACEDQFKPFTFGIYMDFNNDVCTAVCTDAFSLGIYRTRPEIHNPKPFFITRKFINISHAFAGDEEDIKFFTDDTCAYIEFENGYCYEVSIDVNYPNYKSITQQFKSAYKMKFNSKELAGILSRVALSGEYYTSARFENEGEQISVYNPNETTIQVREYIVSEIEVNIPGFSVNCDKLKTMISKVDSASVSIDYNGSNMLRIYGDDPRLYYILSTSI